MVCPDACIQLDEPNDIYSEARMFLSQQKRPNKISCRTMRSDVNMLPKTYHDAATTKLNMCPQGTWLTKVCSHKQHPETEGDTPQAHFSLDFFNAAMKDICSDQDLSVVWNCAENMSMLLLAMHHLDQACLSSICSGYNFGAPFSHFQSNCVSERSLCIRVLQPVILLKSAVYVATCIQYRQSPATAPALI